jgi:hypothetical protein
MRESCSGVSLLAWEGPVAAAACNWGVEVWSDGCGHLLLLVVTSGAQVWMIMRGLLNDGWQLLGSAIVAQGGRVGRRNADAKNIAMRCRVWVHTGASKPGVKPYPEVIEHSRTTPN